MKSSLILLLLLFMSAYAGDSPGAWFLSSDCAGANLSVRVSFNSSTILQSKGPACSAYRDNLDGKWQKNTLTVEFEPNREITWTGYRDEPFDSPHDSVLTVDLWLAGADVEQSIWIIGVSVRDEDTIYMNTLHIADLDGEAESCVAPRFCVATSVD